MHKNIDPEDQNSQVRKDWKMPKMIPCSIFVVWDVVANETFGWLKT